MQLWSHDGVREERTGWRCAAISERHRQWGWNCPAVDLDFVVAEYNHGTPVALIEYKERHARQPVLGHPTYAALKALADGYSEGPLPFIVAIYDPEAWWFRVLPVNTAASEFYAHVSGVPISERRFVKSLYVLRKIALTAHDEATIGRLNDVLPVGRAA